MWYLNKSTGKKWDITDSDILKRVSNDSNYELIVESIKEEKVKKPPKEGDK